MNDKYLLIDSRIKQIYKAAKGFDNVIPIVIDISSTILPSGEDDLAAQTPMVLQAIGERIDAIYGSDPSYAEYYSSAYPFAEYRLLDPDRKLIHISGIELRNMSLEDRKEWII